MESKLSTNHIEKCKLSVLERNKLVSQLTLHAGGVHVSLSISPPLAENDVRRAPEVKFHNFTVKSADPERKCSGA